MTVRAISRAAAPPPAHMISPQALPYLPDPDPGPLSSLAVRAAELASEVFPDWLVSLDGGRIYAQAHALDVHPWCVVSRDPGEIREVLRGGDAHVEWRQPVVA